MKKSEAQAIQAKYNMEIIRDPITGEAWALYLEASSPIKELDDLAAADLNPCAMVASYTTASDITYKLACPSNWFNLWGWKGEEDSNA